MDKEQKALRASAILDDEIYISVWEQIMADTMLKWRAGETTTQEREDLFHQIQALDELNNKFKQLIYDNLAVSYEEPDPFAV